MNILKYNAVWINQAVCISLVTMVVYHILSDYQIVCYQIHNVFITIQTGFILIYLSMNTTENNGMSFGINMI